MTSQRGLMIKSKKESVNTFLQPKGDKLWRNGEANKDHTLGFCSMTEQFTYLTKYQSCWATDLLRSIAWVAAKDIGVLRVNLLLVASCSRLIEWLITSSQWGNQSISPILCEKASVAHKRFNVTGAIQKCDLGSTHRFAIATNKRTNNENGPTQYPSLRLLFALL